MAVLGVVPYEDAYCVDDRRLELRVEIPFDVGTDLRSPEPAARRELPDEDAEFPPGQFLGTERRERDLVVRLEVGFDGLAVLLEERVEADDSPTVSADTCVK